MSRCTPRYQVGYAQRKVKVIKVGPWQTESPEQRPGRTVAALRRSVWWYQVQCSCGGPVYWVSQDQLRTHQECYQCTRKNRYTVNKPEQAKLSEVSAVPVPDFARMKFGGSVR